jgi:hypothetical protein
MHNQMQDKNAKNIQVGWEEILADAEEAFIKTKTHARALKRSIAAIKKKISANEPFPLKASTQN